MVVGFCVRFVSGGKMVRGLSLSLVFVFRGGIGSCICFWFLSVVVGVRSGFGAVRLVRFRRFVAVLGFIISLGSSSSVLLRGSSSGSFGSGLR
jgi:hypothetical protein